MLPEFPLNPDDFAAYYRFAPAALALRECVRLQAVRRLELEAPILDVGCGDGLFAHLAYPGKTSWGVDVNPTEVRRAQASATYSTVVCGDICRIDLPLGFFGSAIANCSLEHVPDLQGALTNIHRALKSGASFALIVPTPEWARHLAIPRALRKAGLSGLANAYGEVLDRVFHHIHLYDERGWVEQLARAGFGDVEVRTLVGSEASWTFDVLLYPSLAGYLTKKLTGRWVLSPGLRPFSVDAARTMINTLAKSAPRSDSADEYLLIAKKR